MNNNKDKTFLYLTFALAILVTISACCGIFIKGTYVDERENWRIQAIGQDMVDLFIIVPILVISGILSHFKKKIFHFIFGGIILFLIYTYAIYCFAVHFNSLFLIYCLTFGLSVYSFIYF